MIAKVDIIVPFQNKGLWLRQACSSLQFQSETNWRALLISNRSNIENQQIAKSIVSNDSRFELLNLDKKITSWTVDGT